MLEELEEELKSIMDDNERCQVNLEEDIRRFQTLCHKYTNFDQNFNQDAYFQETIMQIHKICDIKPIYVRERMTEMQLEQKYLNAFIVNPVNPIQEDIKILEIQTPEIQVPEIQVPVIQVPVIQSPIPAPVQEEKITPEPVQDLKKTPARPRRLLLKKLIKNKTPEKPSKKLVESLPSSSDSSDSIPAVEKTLKTPKDEKKRVGRPTGSRKRSRKSTKKVDPESDGESWKKRAPPLSSYDEEIGLGIEDFDQNEHGFLEIFGLCTPAERDAVNAKKNERKKRKSTLRNNRKKDYVY